MNNQKLPNTHDTAGDEVEKVARGLNLGFQPEVLTNRHYTGHASKLDRDKLGNQRYIGLIDLSEVRNDNLTEERRQEASVKVWNKGLKVLLTRVFEHCDSFINKNAPFEHKIELIKKNIGEYIKLANMIFEKSNLIYKDINTSPEVIKSLNTFVNEIKTIELELGYNNSLVNSFYTDLKTMAKTLFPDLSNEVERESKCCQCSVF